MIFLMLMGRVSVLMNPARFSSWDVQILWFTKHMTKLSSLGNHAFDALFSIVLEMTTYVIVIVVTWKSFMI